MEIEKDTIRITEYNLYDFTKAIEQAVMMGYRIGDGNGEIPQHIGFEWYIVMSRPVIVHEEGEVVFDLTKDDEQMVEVMNSIQTVEEIVEALNTPDVDIVAETVAVKPRPVGRKAK